VYTTFVHEYIYIYIYIYVYIYIYIYILSYIHILLQRCALVSGVPFLFVLSLHHISRFVLQPLLWCALFIFYILNIIFVYFLDLLCYNLLSYVFNNLIT